VKRRVRAHRSTGDSAGTVNPIRSKAKQPAVTLLGELAGRPLELAGNSKPR